MIKTNKQTKTKTNKQIYMFLNLLTVVPNNENIK